MHEQGGGHHGGPGFTAASRATRLRLHGLARPYSCNCNRNAKRARAANESSCDGAAGRHRDGKGTARKAGDAPESGARGCVLSCCRAIAAVDGWGACGVSLDRPADLEARAAELDRGLTLVGPHRDDLLLRVRGLPVKGYASHGESWSVALSLRLASAQLLRAQSQLGDPILILDDVFAELDADRRARLAALVGGFEQVVVTAAVENDVPEALRARTVRVVAGTIQAEDADE